MPLNTAVKSTPKAVGSMQSTREITREALTEFALVHGQKLKRYLARRYGNGLAEDVYQDALVETLKHQPIGAIETGSVDRYIWKIALRRASKLEVKRRLETEKASTADLTEISDLSGREFESTEANQNFARIGEALEQLSTLKRRAFVMRSTSDKSIAEIAEELDITYSNARYHITDATRQVMSRMCGDRLSDICKSFEEEIYSSVYGELEIVDAQKLHRHLLHCGSCRKTRKELLHSKKSVAALVPFFLLDDNAFAALFDRPSRSTGSSPASLRSRSNFLVKGGVGAIVTVSTVLVAFAGGIDMTNSSNTSGAEADNRGPSVSRSHTAALAFEDGANDHRGHAMQADTPKGSTASRQSSPARNQGVSNPDPSSGKRNRGKRGSTNGRGGSRNGSTGTTTSSGPQGDAGSIGGNSPGQPSTSGRSISSTDDYIDTTIPQPPQIAEEPLGSTGGSTISIPPHVIQPCNPKKFVC